MTFKFERYRDRFTPKMLGLYKRLQEQVQILTVQGKGLPLEEFFRPNFVEMLSTSTDAKRLALNLHSVGTLLAAPPLIIDDEETYLQNIYKIVFQRGHTWQLILAWNSSGNEHMIDKLQEWLAEAKQKSETENNEEEKQQPHPPDDPNKAVVVVGSSREGSVEGQGETTLQEKLEALVHILEENDFDLPLYEFFRPHLHDYVTGTEKQDVFLGELKKTIKGLPLQLSEAYDIALATLAIQPLISAWEKSGNDELMKKTESLLQEFAKKQRN